jgi:hypothetical protein
MNWINICYWLKTVIIGRLSQGSVLAIASLRSSNYVIKGLMQRTYFVLIVQT